MNVHSDRHDDRLSPFTQGFDLLRAGVPLSLLLDLAAPVHSDELLREERADTSWVPHAVA